MKKHIFTLVIFLSATFAMAQNTVPNGGFENWSGGAPVDWTTSVSGNVIVTVPYLGDVPYPLNANFGSQITDAHSGNYALKLQASILGVPQTSYNITIPGIAQLGAAGEFNVPMSTITELMNGGVDSLNPDNIEDLATFLNVVASGKPCTSTPDELDLWVKYLPQSSDTMRVIAYTKLGGAPVSYAQYENSLPISDYTKLKVYFDNPNAACDSICIMIISGGMSTNTGTELYVDDVELVYYTGVSDYGTLKVNIYPNPTSDYLFIAPTDNDGYQYELMDMTGRRVAVGRNKSGVSEVDLRACPPGVYMLYMEQKNQTLTKKVVVR